MNPHHLLSPSDPQPVEMLPAKSDIPVILACEHAGFALPERLQDKTPPKGDMERHIAYDVGAEHVARTLAKKLGAALVVQRYSRLVIDSNRSRTAPDLAPGLADGSPIAFNQNLKDGELDERWSAIHQPFHHHLAQALGKNKKAALITIHSFTPHFKGFDRPWHIGFLARRYLPLASGLIEYFAQEHSHFVTALNQPYRIDDISDYTIPVHAESQERPHVLVEIRNDLISDQAGAENWAEYLNAGINRFLLSDTGV